MFASHPKGMTMTKDTVHHPLRLVNTQTVGLRSSRPQLAVDDLSTQRPPQLDPPHGPLAQMRQLPPSSYSRRSSTVEAMPGSSPPSKTRSAPCSSAGGISESRRASGPPERLALD